MFHVNKRVKKKKYNMSIELNCISVFLSSVSFCQVGSDYWGWVLLYVILLLKSIEKLMLLTRNFFFLA